MKKSIVFTLLFVLSGFAYAQVYTFPAEKIKEADIVIKDGTLNIKSGEVKEVSIEINSENKDRIAKKIYLSDEGENLKAFFEDIDINENTVINMILPKNIEADIDSSNASIDIKGIQNDIDIEAKKSNINIEDFNGKLDLELIDSSIKAKGTFKDIDIKSSASNIELNLFSIPKKYEYEIKGNGDILINLPRNQKNKRLKFDTQEYMGSFQVQ